MSLSVTFRHAARAKFIEAAAWYESQTPDLGVEFIAEIERCAAAAAERPMTYSAVYKDVRRVLPSDSRLACTFGRRHAVSSSWPFSMAAGIPRFGSAGLNE